MRDPPANLPSLAHTPRGRRSAHLDLDLTEAGQGHPLNIREHSTGRGSLMRLGTARIGRSSMPYRDFGPGPLPLEASTLGGADVDSATRKRPGLGSRSRRRGTQDRAPGVYRLEAPARHPSAPPRTPSLAFSQMHCGRTDLRCGVVCGPAAGRVASGGIVRRHSTDRRRPSRGSNVGPGSSQGTSGRERSIHVPGSVGLLLPRQPRRPRFDEP